MDTAPLKSFAAWARTALIREVTARIAVVLGPASSERIEQRATVGALEKAVEAAGGGATGRAAVADRVAYTWFNRIIALRFMDANGYTGVGVVSSQTGVAGGQPEILADAKRGQFDTEVVNAGTREIVTGLLDGTRLSPDPQGESYALLLTSYCRHWNRAMPFMFEREGNFTELLIPADLLADESVLNRAARVLTEDVCKDVEVIGWLYQFYISERKDEVFAGFKKNKKAGAAEIPAATQLFTPHWIVRYLVENSLGRLWMLNRSSSRLVDQMDYYIAPVDVETDFLKIDSPEQITIIDPACGSGHMLTYAFDLLYAIYEEEGYASSDIPGLILANNLYGIEIDPRAGALAALTLTMKARARQRTLFRHPVGINICVLEPVSFAEAELELLVAESRPSQDQRVFWNRFARSNLFGALVKPDRALTGDLELHPPQDGDLFATDVHQRARKVLQYVEYLDRRYSVIVANPPYMGVGNMNFLLAEFAIAEYERSKSDLYAMFIERCLSLGVPNAFAGMITMQSWLFTSTYRALRKSILNSKRVVSLVQLGSAAFDAIGGAVVSTTAFVLQNSPGDFRTAAFVDLTSGRDERAKSLALALAAKEQHCPGRRDLAAEKFLAIPGSPFAHTIKNFDLFDGQRLSANWRSGGRLKTHDGNRFIRYWWEVSRNSTRWRPLVKGGDFRAFYGNRDFVVDWSDAAVSIYQKHGGLYPDESRGVPGLCWTKIGRLSFRVKNADEEFDSASPTLFPDESSDVMPTLAYLNSSEVRSLLAVLNPTINTQVTDVLELPAPKWDRLEKEAFSRLGESLTAHAKSHWEQRENSDGFGGLAWLNHQKQLRVVDALNAHIASRQEQARQQLQAANEIDAAVSSMLGAGLSTAKANDLVSESPAAPELVRDLLSYAVGCMLGRYSLEHPGLIIADHRETLQHYYSQIPKPLFPPDSDNVIPVVSGDWFEDDIVGRFRQFLRVAFGEQCFEENLRFVTESLGVKDLRDYFVRSFYNQHVQRYKKRPIYWLFSSPKGSFNALIYMHRYTPSTVSTVLNEYLREFRAKLAASLQHHDRLAVGAGTAREQAAALKEADRLRKVILELDEYEHDVLYPLASRQIAIDLDDGVKVNYAKFGAALKKIPGLEAAE